MKIVLDTNVLMSGLFFGGTPSRILRAWRSGQITLVLSTQILAEYQDVARRLEARHPAIDARQFLDLVAVESQIIVVPRLHKHICIDRSDDKFFACAIAAKATCIVSGDKHLTTRSGTLGVEVLTPAQFVSRYLQGA